MRALTMCAVMLGAGCAGGDDGPGVDAEAMAGCGDGVCAVDEACGACIADCGTCADECSTASPASCDGDDLCIDGACVSAWGRRYELAVVQARVAPRAPDGSAWDYDGGAPDPVVLVRIGLTYALITEVVTDAFVATFEERAVMTLARNHTWEVGLYDADIAGPQPALVCRFAPLSAVYLRERHVRCEGHQPETIGSVVVVALLLEEEP